jgi:glycolate oxidase FAD binding subunit
MKAGQVAPFDGLRGIVGAEHARPASAADAVDGVTPQFVVEPGNAGEVARVLHLASAAKLSVIPRGAGTKMSWGNPPSRADVILSTARLSKILEHAWADMTATVQAGCIVADFQKTLAEHGQRLALDPLWPGRATIGGILATNDSGTLRIRFGTLRDLIIGVTLALPDGTLARSGGKVVKNVAGYDLPKLATASLGTVGVITEAVFRLHPLPQQVRSIRFQAASAGTLCAVLLTLLDSQLAFTGVQLCAQARRQSSLDVRFEGTAAGIAAQVDRAKKLAAGAAMDNAPADAWTAGEALWPGAETGLMGRFSVLPAQLASFCEAVDRASTPSALDWGIVAQGVGAGLVRVAAAAGGKQEALLSAFSALRSEVARLGGSLVALQCPAGWKKQIDVWGVTGDALPLMRSVKARLDPDGTLNPGRFVGGI